jgi:hypothetical protein
LIVAVVVQDLQKLPSDEWFKFKNQRNPPVFTKKIMDAICYLLRLPTDWESQKFLFSDSVYNRTAPGALDGQKPVVSSTTNPTDVSAGSQYDCKLVCLLSDYRVNNYLTVEPFRHEIDLILSDPRFRADSYYIESLGLVAPYLVAWVKANNAYLQTARTMIPFIHRCEKFQIEASRVKISYQKKKDELVASQKHRESTKRSIYKQELDLSDLNEALIRANYMLKFVEDSFSYSQEQLQKVDVYKLLEEKIEKNQEKFIIDTCMQQLLSDVVQRQEDEKAKLMQDAAFNGREYVELQIDHPIIEVWMKEEIQAQQQILLGNGYNLGYGFDDKVANEISSELTYQNITTCAEVIITKLNESYHEGDLTTRRWKTIDGRVFSSRFIYVLTWKYWKDLIIVRRDEQAVKAWEEIFGSIESCAQNAIEAKINHFFSSTAKRQAIIWAKRHPDAIAMMERKLSDLFQANYPVDTAIKAMEISHEIKSKSRSVTERTSCLCWIKYHAEIYEEAKDAQHELMADMFAKEFPDNTAEECFKIVNGIANPTEMLWVAYADQWKAYHVQEYEVIAENIIQAMAKDFITSNPILTHIEAARIIENHAIARFIPDAEVANQYLQNSTNLFNATCYGMKNQGLLRKGKQSVHTEHQREAENQWKGLVEMTSNFQVGSYLYVRENNTSNTSTDEESVDPYASMREKLLKKYAWLVGYLHKEEADCIEAMHALEHDNPFRQQHHNLRPSEEEQIRRKLEAEYMSKKYQLEEQCATIMDRITIWNTYFGITAAATSSSDKQDGHQRDRIDSGVQDEEENGEEDAVGVILDQGMMNGQEKDEMEEYADEYDPQHEHHHPSQHQPHHHPHPLASPTSAPAPAAVASTISSSRTRTPPAHHLQSPMTIGASSSNSNITTSASFYGGVAELPSALAHHSSKSKGAADESN